VLPSQKDFHWEEMIPMPEKPNFLQTELMKRFILFYRKTFHLDKLSAESKKSAANTLLKYAGTWAGDDLEECLQELIHSRGEAQF
jgi:hypothetical protein